MKYKLAFDSETGGLDPKTSDLLTAYFAIVDENLKIIDELDLKLKPNDRLPQVEAGAMKVNKIDLKKHLEDPNTLTYSEAKPLLVALIKKYLKKTGRYSNLSPLGQNILFDISFVQEYLIPKSEWDSMIHYGNTDTKVIAEFLKDCQWLPPEVGNLGSLVKHFNVPMRDAHNAKEDTHMTLDVYIAMLKLMASKKDGGQTTDIISLLESE